MELKLQKYSRLQEKWICSISWKTNNYLILEIQKFETILGIWAKLPCSEPAITFISPPL